MNHARSIVRWSLFALSSFFLFSIGWSPQYELFLVPLILLAFDDPLVGAAAALALQVVTFLDYPLLLPWAYFYGGAAVWLDVGRGAGALRVAGWLCVWVLRSETELGNLRWRVPRFARLLIAPVLLAAAILRGAWFRRFFGASAARGAVARRV